MKNGNKIFKIILAIILCLGVFKGIKNTLLDSTYQNTDNGKNQEENIIDGIKDDFNDLFSMITGDSNNIDNPNHEQNNSISNEDLYNFKGEPYIKINNNEPTFNKNEYNSNKSYIKLSELDALGRTGTAKACLSRETMPKNGEERESIGMVKPSGWKTQRFDDVISSKYLYNRSHQIGWQLSGLNADKRNLMTGTRYFNATTMLPFENMVADYIKETGNHVLYEAKPVYKDNELVARGLQLQAASIEDDSIRFNVYLYNIQPKITINYKTGEARKAKKDEATFNMESNPQEPNFN